MPRTPSDIDHDWRHSTTLESSLINHAAELAEREMRLLARPRFKVVMYDRECP
jgi:hypothetical protein